jgi:hypothetical protein
MKVSIDRVLDAGEGDDEQGRGDEGPAGPAARLVDDPAQPVGRLRRRRALARPDRLEPPDEGGEVAVDPGDRPRLARAGPTEQLLDGEAVLVGAVAGEQRLQEQAEGVHVARRAHRLAAGLLRAHVERRAGDRLPAAAQPDRVRGDRRRPGGRVHALRRRFLPRPAVGPGRRRLRRGLRRAPVVLVDLGEPEVEDLDRAGGREHDVLGLQVAVHDARRVRGGEDVGDLGRDPEQRGPPQPSPRETEMLALDELEHEVVALGALEVVVDATDVRVLEARQDAGLAQEPLAGLALQPPLGANGLQRDAALEPLVEGDVHLAHAPAADGAEDPVAGHAVGRGAGRPVGGRRVDPGRRLGVDGEDPASETLGLLGLQLHEVPSPRTRGNRSCVWLPSPTDGFRHSRTRSGGLPGPSPCPIDKPPQATSRQRVGASWPRPARRRRRCASSWSVTGGPCTPTSAGSASRRTPPPT